MTDRPTMDYARAARDAADATWRRIEADAAEQVRAEVAALELIPLVFGEKIAWAIMRLNRTDDLSFVHRVGEPIGGVDHTTCREPIPPALLRLPLGPGLLRTIKPCKFCEAEYARLTAGAKAA